MSFGRAFVAILFIFGPAKTSFASNALKLFGHTVEVAGPFNEQKLMVDGKSLIEDAQVSIEQIDIVEGTGILIGSSWSGAAVCAPPPFVISFPSGEAPKVYGPIAECGTGDIAVHAQDVEIVYPPKPNAPGHRWIWTLTAGFKDAGSLAFQADSSLGWEALRRHDIAGPIDLYKNREVGAAMKALTGADDETFTIGFSGPSEGKFLGDTYFGTGCMAHNCGSQGSFVIADIASRKIFLAWKEENKPFIVRPPVKDWPGPFRVRLKEWTQNF